MSPLLLLVLLLVVPTVVVECSSSSSSPSTSPSPSSSPFFSSASPSSSSAAFSPFPSSSSSVYTGNSPGFPGCYSCPAITQCPTYPNTSIYPAFAIHASSSASADASACNLITADILIEVTQHAPTNACVAAIGALACYGAFAQQFNCSMQIDPAYPALCLNATSCLDTAGQQFVNDSQLCTNIQAFLNRPTAIGGAGSSSTGGGGMPSKGSRVVMGCMWWGGLWVGLLALLLVCAAT